MFTHRTHVNFIGFTGQNGVKYEPVKTYIWAFLEFAPPVGFKYIIEHPQGFSKQDFFDERFDPAINKYLDTKLQDGKLYLFALSTDMEEITPEPAPNAQPRQEEVVQQEVKPDLSSVAIAKEEKQQQETKTEEPQAFEIDIAGKKYPIEEPVFKLIHNLSLERDAYRVALTKINEALQELNPPK